MVLLWCYCGAIAQSVGAQTSSPSLKLAASELVSVTLRFHAPRGPLQIALAASLHMDGVVLSQALASKRSVK